LANNYFQFKQFTVRQGRCAMKVCTDACIFGAAVAGYIHSRRLVPVTMLDIGSGSGLLSLMLAQKTNAIIDGVEIDEAAFEQAKDNFEQSPWKERLTVFNADALFFYPVKKYDCIISNPPFFEGDLKSGNIKKNAAKHDTTLTIEQLLLVIDRHLSPDGFFALLLPWHRINFFIEIARAAHYFLNEQLLVQHTKLHPFFRGILFFSHHKTIITRKELVIKGSDGYNTPEFIELLKDYYL
jgi:tRNA1Val (adenine37-N6)-methyltransferase